MIKIAIIGLGHIGKIHIQAISLNNNFNLVSVCDQDPAYMEEWNNIEFYESHIEMLRKGGFEMVLVATPNNTHSAISKDVILYGYDLMLEKPASNNIKEFEYLNNISNIYNKKIYYLFHAALASEVLLFKEFYYQNRSMLGELISFKCQFYDPYLINGSIEMYPYGLENPWYDSGVNALSVLSNFINLKNLITVNIKSSKSQNKETSHVRFFEIRNGFFGIIDTAWDQNINFKYTELYFKKGFRVNLNHSKQSLDVIDLKKNQNFLHKNFAGERLLNHYKNCFEEFILNGECNYILSKKIHNKLFEEI